MATSCLPEFTKFGVNAEPTTLAVEWKKWITRFENLIVALEITEESRKRALLLYYAGQEARAVYNTLLPPTTGEDYPKARLDAHFEPARNVTFEVYNFRSLTQLEDEAIDKYVVRLREAASRCGFT